jgi:hypothetical protein
MGDNRDEITGDENSSHAPGTCASPSQGIISVTTAEGANNAALHAAGFGKHLIFQSCRTTLRRELLICRPPLYLMKPSFLNLFIKKFTRDRVVPTISARVSWDML